MSRAKLTILLFLSLSLALIFTSYRTVQSFTNKPYITQVVISGTQGDFTCYYHQVVLPVPDGILDLGTQAIVCGYNQKAITNSGYLAPDLDTWIFNEFGQAGLDKWRAVIQ